MPVGFFFMVGGWLAILAGIALVPTVALSLRRWTPTLRRAVAVLCGTLFLGLGLLAMIPVARADARGHAPIVSDQSVLLVGLAVQSLAAVWAINADRPRRGLPVGQDIAAYASAIFTISLGVFVGRRVPGWMVVPIVALVAVRFVWLPTPATDDGSAERRDAVASTLFFTWTVAVLALQTQLLATVGGLIGVTIAFGIGVVVLLILMRAGSGPTVHALGAGFASFIGVMFAFVLLMPSLAGGRYLLQIGLREIPMTASGTTVDRGHVTRWYPTDKGERESLVAIERSFRSPPVSVRRSADGSSTTGLLFGYRLEARYYSQNERIGASSPCSTELHACMAVAVRRASD